MKKSFISVLLFGILLKRSLTSIVNKNEAKLALAIIHQRNIKEAIFLTSDLTISNVPVHEISTHVKLASSRNTMCAFWNLIRFVQFFTKQNFVYNKKGFIIKKIGAIRGFVEDLKLINTMKYTWIVFDQVNISVPYDAEFLRIQKSDSIWYLTEIYSVKNKMFFNELGTYDLDLGLDLKDDSSMYQRRLNLNGSVINSVTSTLYEDISPEVSFC